MYTPSTLKEVVARIKLMRADAAHMLKVVDELIIVLDRVRLREITNLDGFRVAVRAVNEYALISANFPEAVADTRRFVADYVARAAQLLREADVAADAYDAVRTNTACLREMGVTIPEEVSNLPMFGRSWRFLLIGKYNAVIVVDGENFDEAKRNFSAGRVIAGYPLQTLVDLGSIPAELQRRICQNVLPQLCTGMMTLMIPFESGLLVEQMS